MITYLLVAVIIYLASGSAAYSIVAALIVCIAGKLAEKDWNLLVKFMVGIYLIVFATSVVKGTVNKLLIIVGIFTTIYLIFWKKVALTAVRN